MARHFDDVMLGSIELFCLSAEHGSFTAAAAEASLTPAAVSRSIARLEARLGVRLFTRTTRRMGLTATGEAYFAQCRQALNQLVEAERAAGGAQAEPSGTVRMSLPTPYAHHRVLPLLPAFRARHPAIRLDVHVDNRNVDFAAEGFDLAVRARMQPDSGLVARKLEDAGLVVVGTPAYLRRHHAPRTLADLAGHDCIRFALPSTGQPVDWLFTADGADVQVPVDGGILCGADVLAAVTLVRHGGGLLQTYRFLVEDDLARGTLKEVLAPYAGRSRPMSLLYPAQRHMPLRVRVLIDFLVERLSGAGRAARTTP